MKCANCGNKIKKNFKLCPNCGEKINIPSKKVKLKKKPIIILSIILLMLFAISLVCLYFYNHVDYETLKDSVLMAYVYDEDDELIATGSAVVAFENDIVITNAHVVEDNYKIELVSENNTKYEVEGILDYNYSKDIAILKLSNGKGLTPVKISNKAKIGDDVIAIGSPLGLKNTVSTGIISGTYQDSVEVYQHTAPISSGSSGGALFNKHGKLIGINYASLVDGQNLNLAIPISYFQKEYNKVKKNTPIDTEYYSFLNSNIIRSKDGNNLLRTFLKSKLDDDFETVSISHHYNPDDFDLSDIEKYVNGIVYLHGYYSNTVYGITSKCYTQFHSGIEYCYPQDYIEYDDDKNNIDYKILILKYNSNLNKIIKYLSKNYESYKELLEEQQNSDDTGAYIYESANSDEKIGIFNTTIYDNNNIKYNDQYILAYSCENFDKCDKLKEAVDNFIN